MKTCLLKLFVFSLLLIASCCRADTWLGIGGGTYHVCDTCGYNGFNPGLGIQTDYDDNIRLIGGGYYNSFYKTSLYAGVAYQPLQYENIRFGLMSSVVTNYPNLKVPVMVLPVLSIEGRLVGIDILGAPNLGQYTGLITANLKFKI